MLPERREDVFRKYGIETEAARVAEEAAWTRYFEENPRDRREWQTRREQMRNYWIHFDRHGGEEPLRAPPPLIREPPPTPPVAPIAAPTPSVRSTLSTGASSPARPVPATIPSAPPTEEQGGNETALYLDPITFPSPEPATPTLPTAPMPLAQYAEICVDIELFPARAEEIFARHGLRDPAQRSIVNTAWQARFATLPTERTDWERMCVQRRALIAAAQQQPSPSPPRAVAAAGAPPPVPPKVPNAASYALLVVELEMKPHDKEAIYARRALITPQERRAVDDTWRARIAALPKERAEFDEAYHRIKDGWIDL